MNPGYVSLEHSLPSVAMRSVIFIFFMLALPAPALADRLEVRPGEFIVRRAGVAPIAAARLASPHRLFTSAKRLGSLELVRASAPPNDAPLPTTATETCARFRELDPSITHCSPNYVRYLDRVPDDANFSDLWSLGAEAGVSSIDAVGAWDTTTGSPDVVVALLDTGIDLTHPELAPNLWTNPLEIPGNSIDDDQNGYVDDVHGVSTVSGSEPPIDRIGHGTHVAGTIGAVGNNGIGVSGLAWNVKLIAISTFSAQDEPSADLFDILSGYEYVTALKQRGVPIVALNASFGGPQPVDLEEQAIAALRDAGVLLVAAAGNDGVNNDIAPHYPASYALDNIIAVTATDRAGKLPSFANFGPRSIHIAAPGVGILSTLPGGEYGIYTGTSMAAPHVTGTLALIKSVAPQLSPFDLRARVLRTALPSVDLITQVQSGRFLHAARAVTDAETLPDPTANFVPGASFSLQLSLPRSRSQVSLTRQRSFELLVSRADFDTRPGIASVQLRFHLNGVSCRNTLRIPSFKNRALLLRGRVRNLRGRNRIRAIAVNDEGRATAEEALAITIGNSGIDRSRAYTSLHCNEIVQSLAIRTIYP